MKSLHLILAISLLLCSTIKAENRVYERVYVHTDKDCYLAGEDIPVKFVVINNRFQPSDLSKVGYIEICDTEKPWMQLKLALEKGKGAGTIKIPKDIPSGIYQLSSYTRYMRNEGENVYFKKQIAIINAGQQISGPKRFELVEKFDTTRSVNPVKNEPADLSIKTDKNEYGNRQKVFLSIDNIPDNTADLVISVTRNDSITFVPEVNKPAWLKQVTDAFHFSQRFLPEYEGHIITGRFVPQPQEELSATGAFAGKDIRCFNGQVNHQNGTVDFYTAGIFGQQQIVTSAISPLYEKAPYRVDLLSPFCESLPDSLPALQIYLNENRITERYIGIQIQENRNNNILDNQWKTSDYFTFQPVSSYDLDDYTRFPTISETILEFINKVRVIKVGNKRKIGVFLVDRQRFSPRTLVLLDGVPVYDHEDILEYNPANIKRIDIYDERYLFGGKDFECMVSFTTREGNLPHFQLTGESQLFNYECPRLPSSIDFPEYSTDATRNSRLPDFRHTLYWNPFMQFTPGQPVNAAFYTSDLCGEFKVTVEGITTDGKMVSGVAYFWVK